MKLCFYFFLKSVLRFSLVTHETVQHLIVDSFGFRTGVGESWKFS